MDNSHKDEKKEQPFGNRFPNAASEPFQGSHFPEAEKENLLSLEGSIEHIVYRNEENGYTVCDIATDEGELETAVGLLPYAGEGERLRLLGRYEVHGTYGRQFKIEYYEKELPKGERAILKYLSSGAVKGIGPKTAKRIVDTFGEDTFDILEQSPDYLAQLPGISLKKALEIGENFREQFGMRSVMLFAGEFFGPSTALRIYKRWGSAAVDLLRHNPYLLCREIQGVGFVKADRMAMQMGLAADSAFRIQAGITAILQNSAQMDGHVYIPRKKLEGAVALQLGVEEEQVREEVSHLLENRELMEVRIDGRRCLYLCDYYEAEQTICEKLKRLDQTAPVLSSEDIDRMIQTEEQVLFMQYAPMQKNAIKAALCSGVMLLTGGPGTGKTTVIRAVIRILRQIGCDIALTAPTGRAAKRMSEATTEEAKTIHRLLEADHAPSDKMTMRFRRDEQNPLEENVVIVDESSMVDTLLMSALLKAMRPGSRLILIGDADQLPSVGAGNVLSDILASERFSTVCLKEIFRQAKESRIVTGAHAINRGEMPSLTDKDNDFFFLPRKDEEQIAETVASLLAVRLPRSYGEDIREQIQVITPSRKGGAGTEALNRRLQAVLNPVAPGKKEKKQGDRIFREGDKVMQIRNNYDTEWEKGGGRTGKGVFNGDIGRILEILPREEKMRVLFDDRVAEYDFTALDELDHAYAITVHKSQGSEYGVVVIPVYLHTPRLLTRELLYTAVTRAQKMVILVGMEEAVKLMVENSRRPMRYTGLRALLSDFSKDE